MATEHDVRRISLELPGVTERPSWGQPAWFAKTLMARIWEPGVVTVKTEEREALAGTDPDTFYWTPHHERSSQLVLVRLDRIDEALLAELLLDSYRIAGGAGLSGSR
ncbi:MmcQ/YjbR family DNA-binding protein [Pseudarthrobacter sp. NamE2]|uniref:MmcQ/YjbR family DNA-binding protein n=1 Tax=Pseudarthrobacter sp. NamE2 TaxID=2576838 RepID=UPI0010FF1210|nr:MmcQ/YjbR family DNA-binding protein [Pseudarthrobacter sp. NamE2]TLM83951.1 MmcQ/YjbR family DNA-binding protein [Pseudarthrobacter sp. NamE2]